MHRLLYAFALFAGAVATAREFPVPAVDDATLLKLIPGSHYDLPQRIFPAAVEGEDRTETFDRLIRGDVNRAATWAAIPDSAWAGLITDFAPVSMHGNNLGVGGRDLFTGADWFAGTQMSHEQFLANPYVAYTKEGNHAIYEHAEDMPAEWPFRPNRMVAVPHLDGTVHDYAFFVPDDVADAPPKYNSARQDWLCPAGEVYRARLAIIMRDMLPDLIAAVYHKQDPRAAEQLAVILDRMAEVYPGLPILSQALGHGFARGPGGQDYLIAAEYNEITAGPPPPAFDCPPPWWHGIYDYNYAKFNWGIAGWTDGVMDQLGDYAVAFELVRDLDTTRAFSTRKYGDPAAWEKHVRAGLVEPARVLGRFNPPTLGNTAYGYIRGAVCLGIVSGDQYLFDRGLAIPELYLYNNWLADGMPIDGAFNYALMTYGIIGYRWLYPAFGGAPLEDKFPLLERIADLGFRPVTTLYNIGSKHADQHARFFRSRRPWMPPPAPDAIPYADHERSQCMPVYGLTALRGGAPGSRLELILDHQNTANHVHESRLNVQLFYEGVELLPDFGYSVAHGADPTQAPWKDYDYPHEMLPTPEPKDKWGPWRHQYAIHPEAHCLATIDNWLADNIPMNLHAYLGGMGLDDPGYVAQFVDASGKFLFRNHPTPVDVCRRQVAVLTLPSGRSLAVDFFRLQGGQRHDLYWHVPGDTIEHTLGAGEPVDAPSLAKLWDIRTDYYNGKGSRHYGYALRQIRPETRFPMPDGVWHADFLVKPADYLPRTIAAHGDKEPWWPAILHPTDLRLWGWAGGSPAAEEILGARGPWPGLVEEIDPETGQLVRAIVGFKDALEFLIEGRRADEPGLASSYLHILEPRRPEQAAVLGDVTVLPGDDDGLVARLTTASDGPVWVGSTLNAGTATRDGFALHGRFAMVAPDSGTIALFDGSRLAAAGWQLELAPSWTMELVGVIGDLTGSPGEAALIVASDRPLPTDDTLVGRIVDVRHQAAAHYRTPYTVAAIRPWGDGRWRIDLKDTPTFLQQRMSIVKFLSEDHREIQPEFRMYYDNANTAGRYVRFPRTGWETTVASSERSKFSLTDTPPAEIAESDAFVIYTIKPGDTVTIASHFAARGTPGPDGLSLDVFATGPAVLTPPAGDPVAIATGRSTVTVPK